MARLFQYQQRAQPVHLADYAEVITLDKWEPKRPVQNPVRKALATAVLPFFFFTPPQLDGSSLNGWQQPISQPSRKVVRQYGEAVVEPLTVPAPAETITLDKWFQPLQTPTRRARRAADFPFFFSGLTAVTIFPATAPQPPAVNITRTHQIQYQSKAEPVTVPVAAETITLDKWYQPTQQPTRRRTQQYGERHTLPVPIETITLDKWVYGHFYQRPKLKPPQFQWFFAHPDIPAVAPVVNIDKWTPIYPNQLKQKVRAPHFLQYRMYLPVPAEPVVVLPFTFDFILAVPDTPALSLTAPEVPAFDYMLLPVPEFALRAPDYELIVSIPNVPEITIIVNDVGEAVVLIRR